MSALRYIPDSGRYYPIRNEKFIGIACYSCGFAYWVEQIQP